MSKGSMEWRMLATRGSDFRLNWLPSVSENKRRDQETFERQKQTRLFTKKKILFPPAPATFRQP